MLTVNNFKQKLKRIIDYLIKLGLSEKEAKIYRSLLSTGPTTVLRLANYTGIKRITVHFNIENLIKKGLVSQIKERGRRKLIAEFPESLKYLLEKKEEETKKLKDELPEIISHFYKSIPSLYSSNRIEAKYYEGKDGVSLIYKEALRAKEIRSYVNISMIYKMFPENPQLFPESLERHNLKMWEIVEDSVVSRNYIKQVVSKSQTYYYKFFPEDFDQSIFFDYMIFDGKVGIISGERKIPSGVLISHQNIYLTSKLIFDMFWKLLPSPK